MLIGYDDIDTGTLGEGNILAQSNSPVLDNALKCGHWHSHLRKNRTYAIVSILALWHSGYSLMKSAIASRIPFRDLP